MVTRPNVRTLNFSRTEYQFAQPNFRSLGTRPHSSQILLSRFSARDPADTYCSSIQSLVNPWSIKSTNFPSSFRLRHYGEAQSSGSDLRIVSSFLYPSCSSFSIHCRLRVNLSHGRFTKFFFILWHQIVNRFQLLPLYLNRKNHVQWVRGDVKYQHLLLRD